jgi:lysophospholipase L1-like esterase
MFASLSQNTLHKQLSVFGVATILALSAPSEVIAQQQKMNILAMGDSMMAANKASGRAVSAILGHTVGANVIDTSVTGARIIYNLPLTGSLGLNISKQYRTGNWDWIVLNGGGNDLLFGCGCLSCDPKINRLISVNGQKGKIVDLVARLRSTGAQIVYVGYLHSPGVPSPIDHCKDEGLELERRYSAMAAATEGVHFISLLDLVPQGDRTYHGFDMIHPSFKGSKAIARRIARLILEQRTSHLAQ